MADAAAEKNNRGVGILAIATGVAGFALLASHPGGDAKTFAEVLQNEAANRVMDAVVHGGFIIVLALQFVCYAVLTRGLNGSARALAGLVFFGFGAAFLAASMLMDGLVTPAVAARYVVKPDKIESARVLFVLIGTMVSFLMPIGLAFQSAAIAAWGWALTASGARAAGLVGIGLGGVMLVALIAGFVTMNPLALMGAIAGTSLWTVAVGVLLLRRAAG